MALFNAPVANPKIHESQRLRLLRLSQWRGRKPAELNAHAIAGITSPGALLQTRRLVDQVH